MMGATGRKLPKKTMLCTLMACAVHFSSGFQHFSHTSWISPAKRLPSRTSIEAGGPNQDKPVEYFNDFNNLEAELRFYLQERENKEISPADSTSGGDSALLSFFSLDKDSTTPKDLTKRRGKDEDPLAYSELKKYGYSYLIVPMMNAGGYTEVSEKMGIECKYAYIDQSDVPQLIDPLREYETKQKEKGGTLALGGSLESRMESRLSAASMDSMKKVSQKKKEDIVAKQMAIAEGSIGYEAPKYKKREGMGWRERQAAELDELQKNYKPPQPFKLNLPQRMYLVLFVLVSALGYGKATPEAVAIGLPEDIPQAMQFLSSFFIVSNVLSSGVSLLVAKESGRSIPLWATKSLISGVPSLLELRGLGPLIPEDQSK